MKRLSPQPVIVTVLSSVAVALALSAAIGWWAVAAAFGLGAASVAASRRGVSGGSQ